MVNSFVISMLCSNQEKRSHGDEPTSKSVGYGDLGPLFRKVATNRDSLYCRFGRAGGVRCRLSPDMLGELRQTKYGAHDVCRFDRRVWTMASFPSQRLLQRQSQSMQRGGQRGEADYRFFRNEPRFCSASEPLMVTVMVQQGKLTGNVNRHFHHPSCHFGGKRVLQTNGLLERVAVFGRFLGYQFLPNFTNFDQKRAANGYEGGR